MVSNKYKSKFHCRENFRFYPFDEDAPEIANVSWQGVNPNTNVRNALLPREYPATSVLWKCDIQTGGSQWEFNVGLNVPSIETDSITYRERGFSPLKEPRLSFASGGRPIYYYDGKVYSGGNWGRNTEEGYINVCSVVDGDITHGAVSHMPTFTGSATSLSDTHVVEDGKLLTFTVDGPVLIDLADWSVIRQGDNMPTPVASSLAYDSTTNGIVISNNLGYAVHSTDWTTWTNVEHDGGTFLCGIGEPWHTKPLNAPIAVPTTPFGLHPADIGKLSLLGTDGTVVATTTQTGGVGSVFRNSNIFLTISGNTAEVWDSSLNLLDTIDASSWPAFSSYVLPRKPAVFPIGDGDTWVLAHTDGVRKFSVSSGELWHNPEPYRATPTDVHSVVSASASEGVVVCTGYFTTGEIAFGIDYDTGQTIWKRRYPYRSKHLSNNQNTIGYITHQIVGSDVFLNVPNNTPLIRYG
ncbi:MAG: hypothetical protein R3C18_27935 [Planctomycetaceae bacterium]